MKIGAYTKNDLKGKNYAVLSYNYEECVPYAIESLHVEKEKAIKKCEYLIKEESRKMASPTGWYAIDYMVVGIDDEKILRSMNYEVGVY